MNVLLFKEFELDPEWRLCVRDRRAHHLIEVSKVEPGWILRVGQLNGPMYTAEVIAVNPAEVTLQVLTTVEGVQPQGLPLTLILALPRPQSLKKVLQTVAELGVERLILTGSEFVHGSFFQSSLLRPESLEEHLLLGLEQAISTKVPEVVICRTIEQCSQCIGTSAIKLLADPKGRDLLEDREMYAQLGETEAIILAVGPERGWSGPERAWFARRGFYEFSSGDRVLRVDTAVPVLLGQLVMLRRLLGLVRSETTVSPAVI